MVINPSAQNPSSLPILDDLVLAGSQLHELASLLFLFLWARNHTSASVRAAMEETRGTVSEKRLSILLV
jgi:hypothetical protein